MLWGDARSGLIKYNGGDNDKANKAYWISVVLSKYRAGSFSLLWSPSLNVCVSVPTCYAQLAPSSNSFVSLRFLASCFVKFKVVSSGQARVFGGKGAGVRGGGSLWMFQTSAGSYILTTPHMRSSAELKPRENKPSIVFDLSCLSRNPI